VKLENPDYVEKLDPEDLMDLLDPKEILENKVIPEKLD
jgi:hypothetical protein